MNFLDPVKNNVNVTVSTTYDAVATSIVLSGGEGAKLPDPSTDGEFNLVWYDSTVYPDPNDDPNVEIVRVTAVSTDTLTVTRNQESSGASTKNTGGSTYKMGLFPTKKLVDDIDSLILNNVYPVGSVYINANVSTNPATLLGFGTWVAWGVGKAIVGIDIGDVDFDTGEETGGAKTHQLTEAELASHPHGIYGPKVLASGTAYEWMGTGTGIESEAVGGNQAHNNLQPYQVGYVWKRTA